MSVRSDQARLRLREEMERQRLSQRDVAGLLGWSQSRVGKVLTGRVELGVDDLEAICFALSLSMAEAIRDRGLEFCAEMTPQELRVLEAFRRLPQAMRDAYVLILSAQTGIKTQETRGATKAKPAIGRGRAR